MRTREEALQSFAYHPATAETGPVFGRLRDLTMDFITEVWDLIPDSAEKTLALRGLQTFLMHANCAVALTTPADTSYHYVARVLPPEIDGVSERPSSA